MWSRALSFTATPAEVVERMTMNWAAVEIENADEETASHSASALTEILAAVKRQKAPRDSEVWDKRLGLGHHMYYLSPGLAAAAAGRLSEFSAEYLLTQPNLTDARKVQL